MTGIIIAVLLGWLGGYRFYKKQIGLGILYLFTGGLIGIGWIVDICMAVSEYLHNNSAKKGKLPLTTNVVGCFAECRKNESVQRKEVIQSLSDGCELAIETAYYEGKPFFLVVDPVSGLDIGAIPRDTSGYLKDFFPNESFSAILEKKDLENPIIRVSKKI